MKNLISKFQKIFSTLDPDDLAQDIYFYYEEGVRNFKEKYPDSEISEGFLSSHIYNRILNSLRKTYRRFDSPCKTCPLIAFQKGGCLRFKSTDECSLFVKWSDREGRRSTLNAVVGPSSEAIQVAAKFIEDVDTALDAEVVVDYFRKKLSGELREDFAVFMCGGVLLKGREQHLLEVVAELWRKRKTTRRED